jgi:hypothetical protein
LIAKTRGAMAGAAETDDAPKEQPPFQFQPPRVHGLHPDMDNAPSFYDWHTTFPFLEEVVELRDEIAAEAKATQWW